MEVAPRVHRFGSRNVSFYVVEDGGRLTLVDAGMPGHWRQVVPGLEALGFGVGDVEAIVLTHAHVDHVGFAEKLRVEQQVDVHVEERDARGGRARKVPSLSHYWRPTSWPLLVEGLRNGLLATPPVTRFRTFTDGQTLDVPGKPRAVAMPGHTAGSAALHLSDRGVVFTGDALVTLDPYTRATGPRLMLPGINEDHAQAEASLSRLAALEADVLLPGHGEPWRDTPAAAVQEALSR